MTAPTRDVQDNTPLGQEPSRGLGEPDASLRAVTMEVAPTNYEVALRAEMKRATRCFQPYSSDDRATRAASHRMGHRQRSAVGEHFYVHPEFPSTAFPTRSAAARAALARGVSQ